MRLLLCLALLTMAVKAQAATLPADVGSGAFANCSYSSGSPGVIACNGNLTIGNSSSIVLTENIKLTIGGDLRIGNNVAINVGAPFDLDIVIEGSIIPSPNNNSASIHANITAGGSISFGTGADIIGNVTAGGSLNFGNNSKVVGSCQASGGNYPNFCTAPPLDSIHHLRLIYPPTNLTCNASPVIIQACSNNDCSERYMGQVSISLLLSPASDSFWLDGAQISFSGGSAEKQLRRINEGSVDITLDAAVPTPGHAMQCWVGGSLVGSGVCSVSFWDSGFKVEIPSGIANQAEQGVRLQAVRSSDSAQACVPAFANVSRTVQFWSDYITPDATGRPVSWPIEVNAQPISQSGVSPSIQTLNFNANGEALLSVNYADAGRVQLNARYQGGPATDDTGLVLQGAAQFSKRPYGLCLQTESACIAGDASCPVFAKAGEDFSLRISAHAWQEGNNDVCSSPVTPNFALPNITLTHQRVAPVVGADGTLQPTQYSHQAAVNATTVLNNAQLSEVGVFLVSSAPSSYLGMTIPAASSRPIGRITPDYFALRDADIEPGCSNFTYMGQAMLLSVELEARNRAGQVTVNYHDGFARTQNFALVVAESNNGVDLTSRLEVDAPDLVWQGGLGGWTAPTEATFQRASLPDGPFHLLQLGLQFTDADGIALAPLDMNPNSSDCAASNSCTAGRLSSPQQLRFGRLTLENAFGPEDEPLPAPVRAEYWSGERFVINKSDNCTELTSERLIVDGPVPISVSMLSAFNDGTGILLLSPSPQNDVVGRNTGEYRLTTTSESDGDLPWLQYNWSGKTEGCSENPSDEENPNCYDENPTAEYIFGRYRGNPRRIFWREPLP